MKNVLRMSGEQVQIGSQNGKNYLCSWKRLKKNRHASLPDRRDTAIIEWWDPAVLFKDFPEIR